MTDKKKDDDIFAKILAEGGRELSDKEKEAIKKKVTKAFDGLIQSLKKDGQKGDVDVEVVTPDNLEESQLPDELKGILRGLKGSGSSSFVMAGGRDKGKKFASAEDAKRMLMEFDPTFPYATGKFVPGDFVKRNRVGMARYMLPDEAEGQAAMVIEMFEAPKPGLDSDSSEMVNGVILVAFTEGRCTTFPVDLRFYEKAEAPKTN